MSSADQARVLLAWAEDHWNDRLLPWRSPEQPMARRALVEGLLAQTRADTVAQAYYDVFEGVTTYMDWLGMPEADRMERVAPLGLGAMKLRALNGIAEVLYSAEIGGLEADQLPFWLEVQAGVGPYTTAMVAALHGFAAVPVDTNVDRVGRRVAPEVTPAIWIGEVLEAAVQIGVGERRAGFAAPHVAISMVLDVGAGPCAAGQYPECERCPLQGDCWYSNHGKVQRLLPL